MAKNMDAAYHLNGCACTRRVGTNKIKEEIKYVATLFMHSLDLSDSSGYQSRPHYRTCSQRYGNLHLGTPADHAISAATNLMKCFNPFIQKGSRKHHMMQLMVSSQNSNHLPASRSRQLCQVSILSLVEHVFVCLSPPAYISSS